MARKENAASPRTKKAASLLIKCPALTTSEAMKAADFSAEESNDRTIRRRVQRQRNQVQGTTPTSQEPAVDVLVQFEEKNVHFSPLTVSTAGASSSSVSLSSRTASSSSTSSKTKVDGVKQIRMTAPQKQRDRMNTSKLNDAVKSAFKDATTIYSVERKKSRKDKTKMSAQKVCGQGGACAEQRNHYAQWWGVKENTDMAPSSSKGYGLGRGEKNKVDKDSG